MWLEGILNRKYPNWRDVEYNDDGSARYMPAGLRVLEASLQRAFDADDIVACYPDDLERFIGPRTRVVAVSTHNPLGVTFAAGVYASIFGSSSQPINSHYSRTTVRTGQGQPLSRPLQGDRRGLGWLANQSDQHLGRSGRRLHRRGTQRIGGHDGALREGGPGRVDPPPSGCGPSARSRIDSRARQAHNLWRRGNDDRLRPTLSVLRAGSEPAARRAQGTGS